MSLNIKKGGDIVKKFNLSLIVLLVVVLATTPMRAQAAQKSTVMKKADAVTKELTEYANYYGWEVSAKVINANNQQAKKRVKIETANGTYFTFTQITKKSEKGYQTHFIGQGEKFKLPGVKNGIKTHSDSETIKSFLESRAQKAAHSLASYAEAKGWNTSSEMITRTNKEATIATTFSNKQYKFITTTTIKRGRIPKTTYTRKGTKSSVKGIKTWLEQYKDETTANSTATTPDKPDRNDSAVTDQEVIALVASKANRIINAGQSKGWSVTETNIGTMAIKLHLQNSKCMFDVVINGTNKNGKAVIDYTLVDTASNEDEIMSWLTKYQA